MSEPALLRNEILAGIAKLSTMSHVGATDYEAKGLHGAAATDDEPGGRRPSGGIDRKDDREPEFFLRSSEHFAIRLARAHSAHTLTKIRDDVLLAIEAWQRTPVTGDPEWGSFQWKVQIAREVQAWQRNPFPKPGRRSPADAVKHYGISRATVYRYVDDYGEERAAA